MARAPALPRHTDTEEPELELINNNGVIIQIGMYHRSTPVVTPTDQFSQRVPRRWSRERNRVHSCMLGCAADLPLLI